MEAERPPGGVDTGLAVRTAIAAKRAKKVDIATNAGISGSQITQICQGVSPKSKTLGLIADQLGMTTVELLEYGLVEKE